MGLPVISPNAVIASDCKIGEDTIVWNFSVILHGTTIGSDCCVGSHVEIGHGCKIGDRTRIGKGSFLPPNSRIEQGVFIGPGVIFCDDRLPRAGNSKYIAEPPIVESGASIGAGVVILPGVRIGAGAMIGAGSVVTKDVPAGMLLRGEPSRIQTPVGQN